jgi:ATP-dependent RNA helicase RhlE
VHRIGRTGRAGSAGEALSLVCVDENKLLVDIEKLLKRSLPQEIIPGFEPDPTMKPEPIQNGRNQGSSGREKRSNRSTPRSPQKAPEVRPKQAESGETRKIVVLPRSPSDRRHRR